jgi:RNA polymerase sigma-70 factor, ECF subfamily
VLSELKDLKGQEIADVLGVSLDTVKIRLHRARERLKKEFESGCNLYRDEDSGLSCDRKP